MAYLERAVSTFHTAAGSPPQYPMSLLLYAPHFPQLTPSFGPLRQSV